MDREPETPMPRASILQRVPMARFTALLIAGLAGCLDVTSPGPDTSTYALHRIGNALLPAPSFPDPGSPLVLADTLVIPNAVVSQEGAIITHVRVSRLDDQPPVREVRQLEASRREDSLLVNECPVGSFCIAALVESHSTFLVAGDSLFEQIPTNTPREPRVYGRVRSRPRN